METMIQIVSNVGFPIAMCIFMWFYIKFLNERTERMLTQISEKHNTEISGLRETIEENTAMTKQLCELVNLLKEVR